MDRGPSCVCVCSFEPSTVRSCDGERHYSTTITAPCEGALSNSEFSVI
jgi:hypothetical protein